MLRCGKLVEQLDAIDCAYIEVGKYLGLPTQAYIGMSDSKTLDAQTGFARVPCNRIAYVGELGCELWIPSEQAVHVYDRVVKACCGNHPAEIKNSPFGGLCFPANRVECWRVRQPHSVPSVATCAAPTFKGLYSSGARAPKSRACNEWQDRVGDRFCRRLAPTPGQACGLLVSLYAVLVLGVPSDLVRTEVDSGPLIGDSTGATTQC